MDPQRHLMETPDSAARIDLATDLAIPVVASQGLPALTPRVIADAAGCTRQAVHQWFGDQHALRRAVAARFTARWTRWSDVRAHRHGLLGLLPDCDDVLTWVRVWHALLEAGHRDPPLGDLVAHGRECELDLVRAQVGATSADRVHAVLEGVRWRAVAAEPGYSPGRGATALALAMAQARPDLPLRAFA